MARTERFLTVYYNYSTVKILQIVEICTVFLLTLAVLLYVKILLRKQFCHPNLLVLLISHPIVHLIMLQSRVIRHAVEYAGALNETNLLIINVVSDIAASATFQIVICYSIERVVAVVCAQNYEQKADEKPKFGVALTIGALLYSAVLIILWHMYLLSEMITYGCQYLLLFVGIAFFVALRHVCMKSYQQVADRKDSTIHERFLTARNLNAARLLVKLAPYKCLMNFFNLGLYYWIFEKHQPHYIPFYSAFYFFLNHVQLFMQMVLTVYGHAGLKKEALTFFGIQCQSEETVQNVLGKPMIFDKDYETKEYYKQLNSQWNATKTTRGRPSKYIHK